MVRIEWWGRSGISYTHLECKDLKPRDGREEGSGEGRRRDERWEERRGGKKRVKRKGGRGQRFDERRRDEKKTTVKRQRGQNGNRKQNTLNQRMSITKTRKTKTNKESVAEKRHVQLDETKHWALVVIRNKGMATTATIRHELGQSIGVYFDFYNLQESTLLLPGHNTELL